MERNRGHSFASASHYSLPTGTERRGGEMGSLSAATVLPFHLRRQNKQRSGGLYDRRHENLPVGVSSSQKRWLLYVPETKLKRETLRRLGFVARAADSTSSSPSVAASADKTLIPDDEFTLAKVWFVVNYQDFLENFNC